MPSSSLSMSTRLRFGFIFILSALVVASDAAYIRSSELLLDERRMGALASQPHHHQQHHHPLPPHFASTSQEQQHQADADEEGDMLLDLSQLVAESDGTQRPTAQQKGVDRHQRQDSGGAQRVQQLSVFKLINDSSLASDYVAIEGTWLVLAKALNVSAICRAGRSSDGCAQTLKIVAVDGNHFIEIPVRLIAATTHATDDSMMFDDGQVAASKSGKAKSKTALGMLVFARRQMQFDMPLSSSSSSSLSSSFRLDSAHVVLSSPAITTVVTEPNGETAPPATQAPPPPSLIGYQLVAVDDNPFVANVSFAHPHLNITLRQSLADEIGESNLTLRFRLVAFVRTSQEGLVVTNNNATCLVVVRVLSSSSSNQRGDGTRRLRPLDFERSLYSIVIAPPSRVRGGADNNGGVVLQPKLRSQDSTRVGPTGDIVFSLLDTAQYEASTFPFDVDQNTGAIRFLPTRDTTTTNNNNAFYSFGLKATYKTLTPPATQSQTQYYTDYMIPAFAKIQIAIGPTAPIAQPVPEQPVQAVVVASKQQQQKQQQSNLLSSGGGGDVLLSPPIVHIEIQSPYVSKYEVLNEETANQTLVLYVSEPIACASRLLRLYTRGGGNHVWHVETGVADPLFEYDAPPSKSSQQQQSFAVSKSNSLNNNKWRGHELVLSTNAGCGGGQTLLRDDHVYATRVRLYHHHTSENEAAASTLTNIELRVNYDPLVFVDQDQDDDTKAATSNSDYTHMELRLTRAHLVAQPLLRLSVRRRQSASAARLLDVHYRIVSINQQQQEGDDDGGDEAFEVDATSGWLTAKRPLGDGSQLYELHVVATSAALSAAKSARLTLRLRLDCTAAHNDDRTSQAHSPIRFRLFDHASNSTRIGTMASVCTPAPPASLLPPAVSSTTAKHSQNQYTYRLDTKALSVRMCRFVPGKAKTTEQDSLTTTMRTRRQSLNCSLFDLSGMAATLAARLVRVDARTGHISTNGPISARSIVAAVAAQDDEYDFGDGENDDDGGGDEDEEEDVDTNAAWRWSSAGRGSGEQRMTLTLLVNGSMRVADGPDGSYVRHQAIEVSVEPEPELTNFAPRLVSSHVTTQPSTTQPTATTPNANLLGNRNKNNNKHNCLYTYQFDDHMPDEWWTTSGLPSGSSHQRTYRFVDASDEAAASSSSSSSSSSSASSHKAAEFRASPCLDSFFYIHNNGCLALRHSPRPAQAANSASVASQALKNTNDKCSTSTSNRKGDANRVLILAAATYVIKFKLCLYDANKVACSPLYRQQLSIARDLYNSTPLSELRLVESSSPLPLPLPLATSTSRGGALSLLFGNRNGGANGGTGSEHEKQPVSSGSIHRSQYMAAVAGASLVVLIVLVSIVALVSVALLFMVGRRRRMRHERASDNNNNNNNNENAKKNKNNNSSDKKQHTKSTERVMIRANNGGSLSSSSDCSVSSNSTNTSTSDVATVHDKTTSRNTHTHIQRAAADESTRSLGNALANAGFKLSQMNDEVVNIHVSDECRTSSSQRMHTHHNKNPGGGGGATVATAGVQASSPTSSASSGGTAASAVSFTMLDKRHLLPSSTSGSNARAGGYLHEPFNDARQSACLNDQGLYSVKQAQIKYNTLELERGAHHNYIFSNSTQQQQQQQQQQPPNPSREPSNLLMRTYEIIGGGGGSSSSGSASSSNSSESGLDFGGLTHSHQHHHHQQQQHFQQQHQYQQQQQQQQRKVDSGCGSLLAADVLYDSVRRTTSATTNTTNSTGNNISTNSNNTLSSTSQFANHSANTQQQQQQQQHNYSSNLRHSQMIASIV